jgi:outer membrane biogenesis lipoprotein LolB
MKLKYVILAVALAMIGCSVMAILEQSRQPRKEYVSPEEQLPAAISNYSKTFKLNTNPPIWKTPANGRNTTS